MSDTPSSEESFELQGNLISEIHWMISDQYDWLQAFEIFIVVDCLALKGICKNLRRGTGLILQESDMSDAWIERYKGTGKAWQSCTRVWDSSEELKGIR